MLGFDLGANFSLGGQVFMYLQESIEHVQDFGLQVGGLGQKLIGWVDRHTQTRAQHITRTR